jgi:hypothetical protein
VSSSISQIARDIVFFRKKFEFFLQGKLMNFFPEMCSGAEHAHTAQG